MQPPSRGSRLARSAKLALVAGLSLLTLSGGGKPAPLESHGRDVAQQMPAPAAQFPVPTSEPDSPSPPEPAILPPPAQAQPPNAVVSRELVATRLLSRTPDGAALNNSVRDIALSANGRLAAFTSAAGNLVPNGESGYENVFLIDLDSGVLRLVSAGAGGGPGNGWSSGPALSAGGRFVAYYSWASDMTSGDTNAVQDAFVYDAQSGTNERVSVSSSGAQANGRSGDGRLGARPAISADGRIIAYHSQASNLVEGDTNAAQDVFLRDRATGITERISLSTQGAQGSDDSTHPALSADGRVIAFQSRAVNLDLAHPNPAGVSQLYVHDRDLARTDMISLAADGIAGDGDSGQAALSADGRYVAFSSYAGNLVPGDSNNAADIFVYDRRTGALERVSVSSAGIAANRDSLAPAISADGRVVAYASGAANLTNGDGNAAVDIFVYDRLARHTSRASVAVTSPWTGVEADGDSYGPPALSADGSLVAFVSAAGNLDVQDGNQLPDAFVHERAGLPLYTLAGRIMDTSNQPLAGVTVTAGPHRAVTGSDGRYLFSYLTGGTYTLAAALDGFSFSPPRRTASVLADVTDADFTARADGGPSLAFLSLPLDPLASPAVAWQTLRDTDDGGLIDAWFDHDAPDYGKNKAVLNWDGLLRTEGLYNATLGCYERRCYDGHDGTDFSYRDPDPSSPGIFEPVAIYPAAAGKVAATVDDCQANDRWCNRGYGNEVILDHGNGYFTRYSHLAYLGGQPGASLPAYLQPSTALGVMGSTGNSYGVHLHFAVHRDNGNSRWDGEDVDKPVDPFGWTGAQPDPWAQSADGATSRWLWQLDPKVEMFLFGSQGATLRDLTGSVEATIPPNALTGQVRLELAPSAPAGRPDGSQRSLGRAFWLRVLDWYTPSGAATAASQPDLAAAIMAQPLSLTVNISDAETRHLDMARAIMQRWDEASQNWLPLPTTVDLRTQTVTAESNQLGNFDLQAPLLCPDDALEPDDGYFAAAYIAQGDAPQRRLLDLANDQDWVRFDAQAGKTLVLRVDEVAPQVRLTLEIYGLDGLTRLAADSGAEDRPVALLWTPPEEGMYFARITPAPGSSTGCDAAYTLAVE